MTQSQTAAVQDCLQHCSAEIAPLVCVAHYLMRLQQETGWKLGEIDEVGREVLRSLRVVVPRSQCDTCATPTIT